MKIKHLCVIVPAKNEEKLLPRCLHSIFNAISVLPKSVSTDVILCVDASDDNTLKIGKEIIGPNGLVLEINKTNVGFARKYATEEALKRYSGDLELCWLANTDADCEVPIHWLKTQLELAHLGKKALAGIVKVDTYREHEPQVSSLFQNQYIVNEDGSHPHIHGANLGIRADIYNSIGGWNSLTTAEDHDLWNRLNLLNLDVLSPTSLYVFTSGRRQGRAPHGFAGKLNSFNRNKL